MQDVSPIAPVPENAAPQIRQYANLDFSTAWWLIGNQPAIPVSGTDKKPLMVRFDKDNPPEQIEFDKGFWIFLSSPEKALDMDTAVIDQAVSNVLKLTTTGMTNDAENVSKVREIMERSCAAYGFKLLANEEMPDSLSGYPTVFAVVREPDSPWINNDDTVTDTLMQTASPTKLNALKPVSTTALGKAENHEPSLSVKLAHAFVAASEKDAVSPDIKITAWWIGGNGLDGPGMDKMKQSDRDFPQSLTSLTGGYWIFLKDPQISDEQKIDSFAEFLRKTTGGIASDPVDMKRVTEMTQAFASAYDMNCLPRENMPGPLKKYRNVFLLTGSRRGPS